MRIDTTTEHESQENLVQNAIDEENASRNDVAEGGLAGVVGGAIVGALAGGPLGAIIGAVIGGSASALAVDAVDRYDRESEYKESEAPSNVDSSGAYFNDPLTGPEILATELPSDEVIGIGESDDVEDLLVEPEIVAVIEPIEDILIVQEVPEILLPTEEDIEDDIRLTAYYLWEERGRREGFADEDWYDAEDEVLDELEDLAVVEEASIPVVVEEIVILND